MTGLWGTDCTDGEPTDEVTAGQAMRLGPAGKKLGIEAWPLDLYQVSVPFLLHLPYLASCLPHKEQVNSTTLFYHDVSSLEPGVWTEIFETLS